MTPRSIRRAAERKALKKARKAETQSFQAGDFPETVDPLMEIETAAIEPARPSLISEARLRANRANALKSTGPTSPQGRTKVSLNATKTALTGKTVLLPSDDATVYELHVRRFLQDFQPVGDREAELVQALADTQWRLNRIPCLEMGIYALARIEFGEKFQDYGPAEAAALIEAQAFITYHRQLNNLSIQEARLRRQLQKDSTELRNLQKERADQQQPHAAARSSMPQSEKPLSSFEDGFEFSSDGLDALEDHLGITPGLLDLPEAA